MPCTKQEDTKSFENLILEIENIIKMIKAKAII